MTDIKTPITVYIVTSNTGHPTDGARVIGAYTDPSVADAVCRVAPGFGAFVQGVEVDEISKELQQAMNF